MNNKQKDNMVLCEEENCSYYYYKTDNKFRYCEVCRRKQWC